MKQVFLGILQLTLLLSLRSASQPTSTYTSLEGYVFTRLTSLQSNQLVQVNPTTGEFHVILAAGQDSLFPSTWYTNYATSTDGGSTWQNSNTVMMAGRHAGIDILKGESKLSGRPIIANHNLASSRVFYGELPGFGEFPWLPLLSHPGGEPIWPLVACPADGSIIVLATVNSFIDEKPNAFLTRSNADFTSWDYWLVFPGAGNGGGVGLARNDSGRVCALAKSAADDLLLLESTNNGVTWPDSSVRIVPATLVVGVDTFWVTATVSFPVDVIYVENDPVVVFVASRIPNGSPSNDDIVGFWRQSLGVKIVAGPDFSLSEPVIGVSGNVLFVAFRRTTFGPLGDDESDILLSQSADGGMTWSSPGFVTQTPGINESSLSISKQNDVEHLGLVWVETYSPSYNPTFGRQRFLNLAGTTHISQNETGFPHFALSQNYPNPFNPSTKIGFRVSGLGDRYVSLKVYDLLGREVAELVSEKLNPGSYERTFSGEGLSSGLYFYRLQAGEFTETRKLLLLR